MFPRFFILCKSRNRATYCTIHKTSQFWSKLRKYRLRNHCAVSRFAQEWGIRKYFFQFGIGGSYSEKENLLWMKSRRQSLEIFPQAKMTVPRNRIRAIRDFRLLKYIAKGLDIRPYYIYPDEALEFLLRYFEYDISDENWDKVTTNNNVKIESKLRQKVRISLKPN